MNKKKNIIDQSIELENCTYSKTILMLIIVFYHSALMYRRGGWGPYEAAQSAAVIGTLDVFLASFHLATFVLISGYLFYYVKFEMRRYQKYLPFIGNKVKRLLVPYVFIATIWVAPVYMHYYGMDTVVEKFVLGKEPAQLWFVLMLFWVVAIFWLISDFVNYHSSLGFLIVCSIYCIGMFAPAYYRINNGLQYMLIFYIGFLFRKYNLGNKIFYKIPSVVYVGANIGLFILVDVLKNQEAVLMRFFFYGFDVLLSMVGAIGAFVILQRVICRFPQSKILHFLSPYSFTIYLVHEQMIYFTIGWFNGIVPPIAVVSFNFFISLTVSTLFAIIMNKTRITRFLIGNK